MFFKLNIGECPLTPGGGTDKSVGGITKFQYPFMGGGGHQIPGTHYGGGDHKIKFQGI